MSVKGRFIFLHVLALALIGTWVGLQRRSLSEMEGETAALRKSIRERHFAEAASSQTPAAAAGDQNATWAEIARAGVAGGGGLGQRDRTRLQVKLSRMSAEEIAAALHEIESSDLAEGWRSTLDRMLIGPFIEKAAVRALEQLKHRMNEGDGGLMMQLSKAMAAWAHEDPAAAAAWLDREIAAGTFDSKGVAVLSHPRLRFEASLVPALLKSDPASAAQRVKAFPNESKMNFYLIMAVSELDPARYAALVRSTLEKEKDIADAFAFVAHNLQSKGGFESVANLIREGKLSAAESARAVDQTASTQISTAANRGTLTTGSINAMREWAAYWLPGSQDKITGEALAGAVGFGPRDVKFSFEHAAALALQFHEKADNDDVLASFLQSHRAQTHKEQARPLIDHIADPALRGNLWEKFGP